MGCGCGKNKKKNIKSSRMPCDKPPKKIGNISVPENMTPNQRRSTIAKINNDRSPIKRTPKRNRNIADHIMSERVRKKSNKERQDFWEDYTNKN